MNLSRVTAKYIGKPFKDFGCIEFVVSILCDLGHPLPDEVDGIDIINYHSLVDTDIKAAQITMLKTFRKIGKQSSTKFPKLCDLLVIYQAREKVLFPAVCIGSNMAIASFIRKGIAAFNLDKDNRPIMARSIL